MKFLAFLALYVCVAAAARPMSRVRSRAPSSLEKKAEETCSDHCLSRRDENAKCRHAIFDNDTCPQDSEHEDKMFCCEATDGGNSQCCMSPSLFAEYARLNLCCSNGPVQKQPAAFCDRISATRRAGPSSWSSRERGIETSISISY